MYCFRLIVRKGVRKGEELKAPRYASAATTRDYITTRDIIPNSIKAVGLLKVVLAYKRHVIFLANQ